MYKRPNPLSLTAAGANASTTWKFGASAILLKRNSVPGYSFSGHTSPAPERFHQNPTLTKHKLAPNVPFARQLRGIPLTGIASERQICEKSEFELLLHGRWLRLHKKSEIFPPQMSQTGRSVSRRSLAVLKAYLSRLLRGDVRGQGLVEYLFHRAPACPSWLNLDN